MAKPSTVAHLRRFRRARRPEPPVALPAPVVSAAMVWVPVWLAAAIRRLP